VFVGPGDAFYSIGRSGDEPIVVSLLADGPPSLPIPWTES
jgi:hypothetical protein